jgi:predicted RNase H-like HicB family nuclease
LPQSDTVVKRLHPPGAARKGSDHMLRRLAEAIRKAAGRGTRGRVRWDGKNNALHAEIEFKIEVMEDELDGGYVVQCLNLPGCMSQGETVEEAFDNIGEAIGGVLAARFERNLREQEAQFKVGAPHPRELTVPLSIDTLRGKRDGVPA